METPSSAPLPPANSDPAPAVAAATAIASDTTHSPPLYVKRFHASATLPKRGSALAAGYDLSACEPCTVPKSGGRAIVSTGLQLHIPPGCYGRVAPRSGLAAKRGIDVGAGVIDADYRGQVGVILFNFGDSDLNIKVGDRVAQLILERIATPDVVEVDKLDETQRGEGGFGSTGVAADSN